MMDGYLTVRQTCPVCGTELYHHRADDGPAWATILITGHLMAPLMLVVFITLRPEGWVMALGFSVGLRGAVALAAAAAEGRLRRAAVGQADARLRRRRPGACRRRLSRPARRSATRRR